MAVIIPLLVQITPFHCGFDLMLSGLHKLHTHWAVCVFVEVTLKVHLSDSSTHQPLLGAAIQLFANNTPVTLETSSADGNAYLHFSFRLGTPLVVTATKQGYVPNSVPWTPSKLPGRSMCLRVMREINKDTFQFSLATFKRRVAPKVSIWNLLICVFAVFVCQLVSGVVANDEWSAPLLIYYSRCQNPVRGLLNLYFTNTHTHTHTQLQTKYLPRASSRACV